MPNSVTTWASWWRNAQTLWDIALASPQVVAHRTTRMALAGHLPSERDRNEFHLMGAEKMEAVAESALAMMMQMWQAQHNATLALMGAWWKPQAWFDAGPYLRALPGVTAAGLKPVHKRVTANAQRLARATIHPAAVPLLAAAAPVRRKTGTAASARSRHRGA
jgi:hypothetical protein